MRRGFHTMFRKGLSMEIRKHMIFSGEVQGVGFRYTAYMAAGKLGLTEKLRNGQWIEITGIEEEKIPLKKEKHFRIAN